MRFKSVLLTIALLALCVVAVYAADITGKWVAQIPGRDGTPQEQTFMFKVDGGKVSGSISSARGEQKITEGTVTGDAISFTVVRQGGGGEIKELYKGTVSGTEMKLTRTREGAPGGGGGGGGGGRGGAPAEIVAKKVG